MRVLVQRVASARVEIAGQVSGAIGRGVLVFVGIEETDQEADLTWISSKLAKLRIFPDHQGGGESQCRRCRWRRACCEPIYSFRFSEEGESTVVESCCAS